MPVISAGLMRRKFHSPDLPAAEIPLEDDALLEAVLGRALELGINHFETARGYGTSERQLGRVLPRFRREDYILQTKVRPEADPDRFEANLADSFQRLGIRRLDLLAIHGLNDHRSLHWACRPGGCLARARQWQRHGRIGWIGFSGHGPSDVVLDAVRHQGDGGFDYLNVHWYYIYQCNWPAMVEARERDMGVFVISPSDKGGRLWRPPDKLVRLSRPLTPMGFNDLFCLGHDEVHTISVGARWPSDFDLHLAMVERLETERETVAAIDRRWRECMCAEAGGERPDAPFAELPAWWHTPGHVNLPYVLWLDNLARGWDLLEHGRARYGRLGHDMPWVWGNQALPALLDGLGAWLDGQGLDGPALLDRLGRAHALLGRPA